MENKRLYVIITVLSVLVLTLGGYIVYDKFLNKNSKPTNSNNTSNSTNINSTSNSTTNLNSTTSSTNSNNFVAKLNNSKSWVYDAEYKKNVSADSYKLGDYTFYAKDIIVPFINVNSPYANSANNKIKEVFNDAINAYNEGVKGEEISIDVCNYQKYIKNNILSVVLTYGVGGTDVVHPEYYSYNINLNSGNKLSYQEIYTIAGFNANNINSKVEKAITNIMKEELKDFKDPNNDTGDGGYYPDGTNFDTYNNKSINNYKNSIKNNTLKYFLSENGNLQIIVTLIIPAGSEEFDTIITVY